MSQAEFEAEATRAAYISGVATALRVAEASVSIDSVVEQSTGRRRKLLLTSIVVETRVIVAAEQAKAIAGRITTDNLNSALSSAGIFVDEVSGISTFTGRASLSAWGTGGIAVGGVLLALVVASVVWYRRRTLESADNVSSQVSGSLGYFEREDAPEEATKEVDAKQQERLAKLARDEPAGSLGGSYEVGHA
jgi:hypothetical protein